MKRIVLTGAGGYLATHLAHHLTALGQYHLTLINRSPRPGRDFICADISRWEPAWTNAFRDADAVVHLAAVRGQGDTWADVQETNIQGTLNVLEAAVQGSAKRFIFPSSSWVVGGHLNSGKALTPDLPPSPQSPYAISKALGESLVRHYSERHGISGVCFRLGSCHEGEELPASIKYDRQQKWLSVRDFCQAVERALEAELPSFSVFNLTSDIEGSPWDISASKAVLGYVPDDRHVPRQLPLSARLLSRLKRPFQRVKS